MPKRRDSKDFNHDFDLDSKVAQTFLSVPFPIRTDRNVYATFAGKFYSPNSLGTSSRSSAIS